MFSYELSVAQPFVHLAQFFLPANVPFSQPFAKISITKVSQAEQNKSEEVNF